eukprot:COSAG03_NODE_13212_length_512_cov_0.607748_1_plen_160_part_01
MLCCCVSCFVIRRCITLTITSYVALLRGEVTPPPPPSTAQQMPDDGDGDGDGDGARGRLHLCVPNVWCALPCCVAFCWSLKRVSELAEHVNESKRQSESRERVSAIAAAFGRAKKKSVMLPTSYRGAPFELMSAARTWLRDGDVWETSTRGGADLKLRTC